MSGLLLTNKKIMPQFYKSVLLRFVRGAVAGAVSAMVMFNFSGVSTFADVKTFFTALGIAGIMGAVSGGLLAADKFLRGTK